MCRLNLFYDSINVLVNLFPLCELIFLCPVFKADVRNVSDFKTWRCWIQPPKLSGNVSNTNLVMCMSSETTHAFFPSSLVETRASKSVQATSLLHPSEI